MQAFEKGKGELTLAVFIITNWSSMLTESYRHEKIIQNMASMSKNVSA